MTSNRTVLKSTQSLPTHEGAGVHLRRAFGFSGSTRFYDPFLLLDDFRGDNPDDYLPGFPWHPHRGIETITYMLEGTVEHGDSMGNAGIIGPGDVQWMTAGSGIVHQEMPKGNQAGRMGGFQLWANLPAAHKMMDPRYQEIKSAQIPEVSLAGGVKVRVICGEVKGKRGPVTDVMIDPEYLDVSIPAEKSFTHATPQGHTVLAYVIGGAGSFSGAKSTPLGDGTLVQFSDGDQVKVTAGKDGMRFLLISGKPIGEPVAWYGPIVMNTREELETAFEEYEAGTFIKHPLPPK